MRYLAIKGGIGDFLQCLPHVLAHPGQRYFVASHYDRAPEFFRSFGIEVEDASYGRIAGADPCPRQLFFDANPFPRLPPMFCDDGPVVGVHLGGSRYSLSIEKRFGFPPKALPRSVLDAIVTAGSQYNFMLFGAPDELAELGAVETPNFKIVRYEKVVASLSRVSECSAVVASDSAFKTMSAMLRIPTVAWVGDYKDEHRDDNFVDPYVRSGVMSVYRYRDLGDRRVVRRGVEFSLDQINPSKQSRARVAKLFGGVLLDA